MKLVDIIARAARSLRQAKARTLLTSLAIAVGAFTLTISLAAGEGARQYTDTLIGSNINPQLLFIVKDKSFFEDTSGQNGLREYDPNISTNNRGRAIKQLTQADVDALTARDDLEKVVPIYNIDISYLVFEGSDTKFSSTVQAYDDTITTSTSYGSLPPLGTQLTDSDIVLPDSFADPLLEKGIIKKREELLGKKVTLVAARPTVAPTEEQITTALMTGGQGALQQLLQPEQKEFSFTVRALTTRSSTSLTATSTMSISSSQARVLAEYSTEGTDNFQKYIGVTGLAKEGKDPAAVKAEIEKQGFAAQTAKDLQNLLFTIVNILQGIVAGFGILALIASVFGIINTQYISVLERTQQIGLMKALGMRGRHVSRLFQFEAAWIGVLGGVIGSLIAVIAGTSLNPWITETLDLGEGNYLLIFQPVPILLLIVALAIVAMLAGYFPARKAARLDPIEALRTE